MPNKNTLSGMMLEGQEPEETKEIRTDIQGGEEMQIMMFLTNGRLGQGLALIESASLDKDEVARVRTAVDVDGKIWLEIETKSGIHVMADALPLSNRFTETVYIRVFDLCRAVKELAKEQTVALWVAEGKLYLGGYYNEEIGGFELEVGFENCDEFTTVPENEFDTVLELDQMTFNTVLDSIYEFDNVEIYRMNNTVSYRTGNEKCTIATVMQNQNQTKSETSLPNFSVRIPSRIFKTLPLVNALDDELGLYVKLKFNTKYRVMKVEGQYASLVCDFTDGALKTFNNDGMVRQFTIMSDAIAAAIGTYFNIHSTDPTGLVKLYCVNDGLLGIETVDQSRMDVNLTVGNVTIDNADLNIEVPMDVLTMMIRKSGCPKLDLLYNKDAKRLMMVYGNGLFLRKCCYQA